MKKNIMLLSVLATLLFVLPSTVDAAAFVDPDGDGVYANDEAISAGMYGTFEAGDVTWTYATDEDEADGIKTWNFYLTVGSVNWEYIYMELVPINVDIESTNPGSGTFLTVDQSTNSTGVDVLYQASRDLASGERVLLVTVITRDTADEGCQLNVSPLDLDCSVNIPGIYFDNDGNEITAEKYQQVCGNTTPSDDPNDVPNSQTGSVVPYVAIGGGLLAVVAVYLFSRKSNKVYKI